MNVQFSYTCLKIGHFKTRHFWTVWITDFGHSLYTQPSIYNLTKNYLCGISCTSYSKKYNCSIEMKTEGIWIWINLEFEWPLTIWLPNSLNLKRYLVWTTNILNNFIKKLCCVTWLSLCISIWLTNLDSKNFGFQILNVMFSVIPLWISATVEVNVQHQNIQIGDLSEHLTLYKYCYCTTP